MPHARSGLPLPRRGWLVAFAIGVVALGATSTFTGGTQEPSGAGTTSGAGPPVIVYTYDHGLPRNDATFPDLIAYRDGTVLSHGDVDGNDPFATGRVYRMTPTRVQGLVRKLRAIGVFRQSQLTEWSDSDDFPHVSIQVRAADGRSVMLECQAGNPSPTTCATALDVAAYLNPIVEGLRGGTRYRPRGYLLEVRRTDQAQFEPAPWPIAEVDLRATGEGRYGDLVLPPRLRKQLLALREPYYPALVEHEGFQYEVRWRPLYPHE